MKHRQLAAAILAALRTKPVAGAFLFGPPGAGKSALAEVIAKVLSYELVAQQMFPGSREEDLLIRLVPDPEAPAGIRGADGALVQAGRLAAQGQRVVVLLDEWDKVLIAP